jgi:hypothetical protein
MRWALKLAEYDFDIEHKAGKKHVNADCLSRHITSITTARDLETIDQRSSPTNQQSYVELRELLVTIS